MLKNIKIRIFKNTDKIFNSLYYGLESTKGFKLISTSLVIMFLSMLGIIILNNLGVFPESISSNIPKNYFYAVEIVFKLLLGIEIIEMVFVLAYSISKSMAKQFEILSLILLRQAFKEFSYVELPLNLEHSFEPVYYILSDIFGALLLFLGVYIFKGLQKHRPITLNKSEEDRFTSVKKALALIMFITFIGLGLFELGMYLIKGGELKFFGSFYTVLIFTDILIVIIALRYSHSYSVVFRNTGFAIATILIRMALSVPHYFDAILGVVAMIFVIILSIIYNKFEIVRIRKIVEERKKKNL